MLILNILTPNVIPRILSNHASKSVKVRVPQKKMTFQLPAQKSSVNGFLPNWERTFPSWKLCHILWQSV